MDNKTLPFSRGPNWQQHYQQPQIVSILPGEFFNIDLKHTFGMVRGFFSLLLEKGNNSKFVRERSDTCKHYRDLLIKW